MTLSKIVKRFFIFIVVFIGLIIAAAFAIPYFFKDEILAKIKEEANKTLNAEVDFSDVNLSLFRSFPNFSFNMADLKVTGIEDFETVNLVSADQLDFTLDLLSVIYSDRPIEIQSVSLEKPSINIQVLKNGKANYDIVKGTSETTESTDYNFLVQLKNYEITDGSFIYDDRVGDIFVKIEHLNHSGKGDFTQDIFDLVTKTSIESFSVTSGGIPYLKKAQTSLDATFKIDLPNSKYTLKDNDLQVNAMKLLADGFVQMPNAEDIVVDFNFNAPQNNFKNLLSLIPSAFTSDFSSVKADGKMAFDGFVKGTYNGAKNQLPAFKIKLDIDNGSFQYPDLPMGMSKIYTKVNIESPSSNFDQIKIDIPTFKLNLGTEPFEGYFKLRTPISDPNIDTKVKGKLNLADINKAFPMDGVTELSGILDADATIKTRLSTIEKEDYENVEMAGDATLTKFNYKADGLPKISIEEALLDFTPKRVIVKNFKGNLGKSDLEVTGNIDNLLAYFSPEKTMTGYFNAKSNYFDLDEWMTEEETTTATAATTEETEFFDRFDFKFDANARRVKYDVYELTNSTASGSFSPTRLALGDFKTNIGASDLSGSGELTNIFAYVFDNETLGGNMKLRSNVFDLNPFMEETTDPQAQNIKLEEETYEPIVIPDNIDMDIDAKVGKVIYTNLELKDFQGDLKIKNSIVDMKNVETRMLGGKMVADGSYNTQNPDKPTYKLTYDITKFDFSDAFEKFNTFQKLAPIAKYITGNFSSKMSIGGAIGKDFMPLFETITGEGFLQTTNGFIQDFKPLQLVGEKLNLAYLKKHKIDLAGSKNWFTIENGIVDLKEFPLNYKGIDMKIGGKHSLTNEMDYNIMAKIPIKELEKTKIGATAASGFELLNKEAKKLGLDINAGEFVNVLINMKGSMKDPKISLKLLGSEGNSSLKDVVSNVVETAKEEVIKKVDEKKEEVKEDLSAKADAEIAVLKAKTEKQIESLLAEANKQAESIRKEGKALAEKGRVEGYKQADDLVKAAGDNIFKKKAAEVGAKELRKKTDEKADQLIETSNKKGDEVVAKAEEQAANIRKRQDDQIVAIKKKYE